MKLTLALLLLALPGVAQTPQKPAEEPLPAELEFLNIKPRTTTRPPTGPLDRQGLAQSYAKLITEHYPEHKDIRFELLPNITGGSLLFASHPLFTRYEFKYGPLVDNVRAWVIKHRDELMAAKIRDVGIGRTRLEGREINVKDPRPRRTPYEQ